MGTQKWLERSKSTYRYHRAKRILDPDWTINKTAQSLKRSFGSVCEDIKIASWLKTHEKQIENCGCAYKALEFIRKKKQEIEFSDIE